MIHFLFRDDFSTNFSGNILYFKSGIKLQDSLTFLHFSIRLISSIFCISFPIKGTKFWWIIYCTSPQHLTFFSFCVKLTSWICLFIKVWIPEVANSIFLFFFVDMILEEDQTHSRSFKRYLHSLMNMIRWILPWKCWKKWNLVSQLIINKPCRDSFKSKSNY